MSLYGQISKIDTPSFQFDRIYNNRSELDANATSDGVYAGRYVLVEYGEKFPVASGSSVIYNEQNGTYVEVTNSGRRNISINPTFAQNANIDFQQYGNTYDSTVWQKVYIQNQEQYKMVAELNAKAPQLDVNNISPVKYSVVANKNDGQVLAGIKQNNETEVLRLTNAKEEYQTASFNTALDTELKYILDVPKVLELEAGNHTIDFNSKGFNIAYSYGTKEGPSTIALLPILPTNSVNTASGQTDSDGIKQATLKTNQNIDSKELFINFPAFGNAMNTIYDLIYGAPTDTDLSTGKMRPYFRSFIRTNNFQNKLRTPDNQEIKINGENVYVSGPIEVFDPETNQWTANEVEKTFTYSELVKNGNLLPIVPETVVVGYENSNGELVQLDPPLTNGNNYTYKLYNTSVAPGNEIKQRMSIPDGDDDPNMVWLKDIPSLSSLVKTNAMGLASILSSLFYEKDPITGTISYYLYTDWTADTYGENNIPGILNKPKVIGGHPITFLSVSAGQTKTGDIKVAGTLEGITGGNIDYPHTEILTSSNLSGGHYKIDYSTWQLSPI